MKIVVALHDYLPLHTGGSEVHAHQTAAELARRGHEVTALFTERDLSRAEGEERHGELDGVRTIEVVHQREYADLRETWTEPAAGASFARLMAELAPDVVHFHHVAMWGSGALVAARDAGARVLITLHDFHMLCDAATLLRPDGELCGQLEEGAAESDDCTACIRRHPMLLERWGVDPSSEGAIDEEALWSQAVRERRETHRRNLAAAHQVIAPSHFLARTFAQAGFLEEEDTVVLKAGYPGTVHEPRSSPRSPLRVGYVGGLYHSKGVHVLVRAFGALEGEAELHLHGHLDWFPDYADELRSLGSGLPVHFHGPFAPARIDEISTLR